MFGGGRKVEEVEIRVDVSQKGRRPYSPFGRYIGGMEKIIHRTIWDYTLPTRQFRPHSLFHGFVSILGAVYPAFYSYDSISADICSSFIPSKMSRQDHACMVRT